MFEYMRPAEDTADDIAKLYQKASGYISHELDKIFERYKRKHHLTDAEAYRLLNDLKDKTSLDELKQALRAPGRGQTAADILAELESQHSRHGLNGSSSSRTRLTLPCSIFISGKRLGAPAIMWTLQTRHIIGAFSISSNGRGWVFLLQLLTQRLLIR